MFIKYIICLKQNKTEKRMVAARELGKMGEGS